VATFQNAGAEFYYEVHGEGEPLVLIPGLTLDSTYWQPMVPLLERQFKLIIMDNRDIGKTKCPPVKYEISDMAKDVALLMQELKIERFHALGFSMGGLIVQSLAVQFPERLKTLVIAGMGLNTGKRTANLLKVWLELYDKLPLITMIKEQLLWTHGDAFYEDDDALELKAAELAKLPNPPTIDQFTRQVHACLSWQPLQRSTTIETPTLILIGSEDKLFTVTESHALCDVLRRARLRVIEGAGHHLFWERPDECADLIKNFCLAPID